MDALKSIPINAAYQYFEEKSKGSLELGKLSDLVILDRNPLSVDPMTIKDVKVVETIKEGRSIYSAAGKEIKTFSRKGAKVAKNTSNGCLRLPPD